MLIMSIHVEKCPPSGFKVDIEANLHLNLLSGRLNCDVRKLPAVKAVQQNVVSATLPFNQLPPLRVASSSATP